MRTERIRVVGLAIFILVMLGVYVKVRSSGSAGPPLLPYQALARTLSTSQQNMFRATGQGLLTAEAMRAESGRWPDPAQLAARGTAPFASDAAAGNAPYTWTRFEEAQTIDYLGIPEQPSDPAWLLVVQEPTPGALLDLAPNDEQHHRLPDGTVLHVYIWTHPSGGRVSDGLTLSPQTTGWTQILLAPANPILPPSR